MNRIIMFTVATILALVVFGASGEKAVAGCWTNNCCCQPVNICCQPVSACCEAPACAPACEPACCEPACCCPTTCYRTCYSRPRLFGRRRCCC